MCSNPITFIQALAKTLNELLCTLNCHLIAAKHCHKSKWGKPSGTGMRNPTLVTFWKHKLKNAHCHPPPGPPVSTRKQTAEEIDAALPSLWSLGAHERQPATGWLEADWLQWTLLRYQILRSRGLTQREAIRQETHSKLSHVSVQLASDNNPLAQKSLGKYGSGTVVSVYLNAP